MAQVCESCGNQVSSEGGCESPGCSAAVASRGPGVPPAADLSADVFDQDTDVPGLQSTPGGRKPSAGLDPVGLTIPGYEIRGIAGEGGMGVVLDGVQLSLGRRVAVKVLPTSLAANPDLARRFEREAEAMARLAHPNIVGIYDRGRIGDQLYFVMEFVEPAPGEPRDLRQAIDRGRLDSARVGRIVTDVAGALGYAHRQGIVHRDVKPSNVMLDRHAAAKVVDFGIAALVETDRAPAAQLTMAGSAMGTFGYMAPEQRRDAASCDHRADVFSLGVMLYEMLTGELPAGASVPPSHLGPGLSSDWDAVVFRAMDPRPERRFQDMAAFAAAVGSIGQSAPVEVPGHKAGESVQTTERPTGTPSFACPTCSAQAAAIDQYCGGCGHLLHAPCPRCGVTVRTGTRYCPGCRFDIETHSRCRAHATRAEELLTAARTEGRDRTDRLRDSLEAAKEAASAVQLDPTDATLRGLSDRAQATAINLLSVAAKAAVADRNFAAAAAHLGRIIELDPGHEKAAQRFQEITQRKTDGLTRVRVLLRAGDTAKAVDVIESLAAIYGEDPEVAAERSRIRELHDLVWRLTRNGIVELKESRRFVELAKLLGQVREAEVSPVWLPVAEEAVRKQLDKVAPAVAAAKAALDSGLYGAALDQARAILAQVSDHPAAREVAALAEERLARVISGKSEVRAALDAGRWFHAALLLKTILSEGTEARFVRDEVARTRNGLSRVKAGIEIRAAGPLGFALLWAAWYLAITFTSGLMGSNGDADSSVDFVRLSAQAIAWVVFLVGLSAGALLATGRGVRIDDVGRWACYGLAAVMAVGIAWWSALAGIAWEPAADPLGPGWLTLAFVSGLVGLTAFGAGGLLALQFTEVLLRGVRRSPDTCPPLANLAVIVPAGVLAVSLAAMAFPLTALTDVPAAMAVGGVLGLSGVNRSTARYVVLLAAAVVGGVIRQGAGDAGGILLTVGDSVPCFLVLSAAVITCSPFRVGRSAAVAVAAGVGYALFKLLPGDLLPLAASIVWFVAVGELMSNMADAVDLRSHGLDRFRYWTSKLSWTVSLPADETVAREFPPFGLSAPASLALTLSTAATVVAAIASGWLSPGVGAAIGLPITAALFLITLVGVLSPSLPPNGRAWMIATAVAFGSLGLLGGRWFEETVNLAIPEGWEVFAPPDEDFEVLFPKDRNRSWSDLGTGLNSTGWHARPTPGGPELMVFAGTPNRSDRTDDLAGTIRDSLTARGFTVGDEQAVRAGRYTGVEVSAATEDGKTSRIRAFRTGDRIYVAMYRLPAGVDGADQLLQRFLRSFRPTPEGAEVTREKPKRENPDPIPFSVAV